MAKPAPTIDLYLTHLQAAVHLAPKSISPEKPGFSVKNLSCAVELTAKPASTIDLYLSQLKTAINNAAKHNLHPLTTVKFRW